MIEDPTLKEKAALYDLYLEKEALRKEKRKEYKEANKERYRQVQNEWRSREPRRIMVYSARERSKHLGIECTISVEDIEMPTHCPILGIKLDFSRRRQKPASPSLDRVDVTKGYVPGNVRVVSQKANRLKNDLTPETIQKISDYMNGSI
jgi:hypothetical protein